MGIYTTPEAVQAVLARDASQYDSTAAGMDRAQLEEAIESAGVEIDAKLGLQYKVPFSPFPDAPPLIHEIARDIAAFLADLTFRQDVDYTSENEPIIYRHNRAQSLLNMVQMGSIILEGVVDDQPPAKSGGPVTVINGYEGQMFRLSDFDLGHRSNGYPLYPVRTDYY